MKCKDLNVFTEETELDVITTIIDFSQFLRSICAVILHQHHVTNLSVSTKPEINLPMKQNLIIREMDAILTKD